jgi:hypothetical protein
MALPAGVRRTVNNPDIGAIFNSTIFGGDDIDYSVTWPKFKRLKRETNRLLQTMRWFQERVWMKAFPAVCTQFGEYIEVLGKEFKINFDEMPDLDQYMTTDELALLHICGEDGLVENQMACCPDFDKVPEDVLSLFSAKYKLTVEADLTNTFVKLCHNLTFHKCSIENHTKLNRNFLLSAGQVFSPFPGLLSLNFKKLYQSDLITAANKETLLIVIHKLYTISHSLYEVASMPDVNVDDFVEIIQEALSKVTAQMPECKDAFRCLDRSVDLLKENFGSYCRDVRGSGNASIIMENYVLDVANNTENPSVALRGQFRKIVTHYRKVQASQPKTPGTAAMFSELEKTLNVLEGNADKSAPSSAFSGRKNDNAEDTAEAPDAVAAVPEEKDADAAILEGNDAAILEGNDDTPYLPKEEISRLRKAGARARKKAVKSIDDATNTPFT